jgi:hypothetical protein
MRSISPKHNHKAVTERENAFQEEKRNKHLLTQYPFHSQWKYEYNKILIAFFFSHCCWFAMKLI